MTTDFVVLTAAIIGIGLAVVSSVSSGATEQSGDVAKCMKIQGKMINKNISHAKQLKRTARKCKRL